MPERGVLFSGTAGQRQPKVFTLEQSNDACRTGRLHAEERAGDPFTAAVRAAHIPMIITDPRQDDNPIVFVNDAFCRVTGYSRDESIGRNCRFLQGPETDPAAVADVRAAIEQEREISIELLNYRKDGRPFWNSIHVSPVSAEGGALQFFFSSQIDMTEARERERAIAADNARFEQAVAQRTSELQQALEQKTMLLHEVDHRVKNNLQMISAMMRNQIRVLNDEAARQALQSALSRVEILGVVHRRLYESADLARFRVADFIRETATDLVRASGRQEIELELELEDFSIPANAASGLSLLVNELITNALKHAFPEKGRKGRILVRTQTGPDGTSMTVEDNGVGFHPSASQKQTFGRRLIESLVVQTEGAIEWSDAMPGTRVVVTFPPRA